MNAQLNLERRLSDFYETEVPRRAPDWLLARTLETIQTIPQRRTVLGLPWRFPPMPSQIRLAVTAVAIVAVGAVGLSFLPTLTVPGASPSPSPSASTPLGAPPPLTERFDSPQNGVSINYPTGWQVRPASQPWGHGPVVFDAPDVDVISDPTLGDDLYLAIASEALDGQAPEDWCCTDLWAAADLCRGGHGFGAITVAGAKGYVVSCGLTQFATVATSTHGYVIALRVGNDSVRAAHDWGAWFDGLLETVALRPAGAAGT